MDKKARDKLLELVNDVDIGELADVRLIDLLADRLKEYKAKIKALEGENAHERLVLHSEQEKLIMEQRELRKNPLYGAFGEYYFRDGEDIIEVRFHGGYLLDASRVTKKKNIRYYLQQIPPSEAQS